MTAPMNNTPDDRAMALEAVSRIASDLSFIQKHSNDGSPQFVIVGNCLLRCETIRKTLETPAPVWNFDMDAAPKDGEKILLVTNWGVLQGYWHQPANKNYPGHWDCFQHSTRKPKAWMPLPDKPTPPELKD